MSRRSPDFKRNNSIAELISDTRIGGYRMV